MGTGHLKGSDFFVERNSMRAVLKLELIGDDYFAYRKFHKRTSMKYERNMYQFTKKGMRPWVARITGFDDHYVFAREFIRGIKDYTFANSTGSRGIFAYYPLKPGIYEVNERISWRNHRRYFIRVENTEITEISKEEIERCLKLDLV
jgi:hypothetical protein